MNTTTDTTKRDRLFFQREQERRASIAETRDVLEGLATAVCERLVDLDLVNDAFDETYDSGQPNPFRGIPRPALQIRCSGVVLELIGAVRQLHDHARALQREARRTSSPGHLERIGRGFEALAAEGRRIADSYGRDRDERLPNWDLINRIHDGVRQLERQEVVELSEEICHDLTTHDQRLTDLRATGLGKLADRLDSDPAIQRALATMREFVGGGVR